MSVVIGIVVGILAAVRQDSMSDYVGRILAILALSVPYFGLAVVVGVVRAARERPRRAALSALGQRPRVRGAGYPAVAADRGVETAFIDPGKP